MVDRISTFSQSQSLINSNLRIQSKYAQTQTQISSGLQSDTYQGISADTASVLSLENQYNQIISRSENAERAMNYTETMYQTTLSITDLATSFLSDLSAAISSTGYDATQLQTVAEQNLSETANALNVQFAGSYLFAGSATTTAPIDLSSYAGTTSIPSTADDTYYTGNNYTRSVTISDEFTLNYGITADNSAFEQVMRAYSIVENGLTDTASLTEAYDILSSAITDLSNLSANISQDSQTLDKVIDDQLAQLNLLENSITDIKQVDLAEASVQLQELETQLEASYSVTTKLLNLRLSDYI